MAYWKKRSLLDKTLIQFILYTVVILLLATPLFYILTKNFYAEDMLDIIEKVRRGRPLPKLDLEEDIMKGVMLQFGLISAVLGVAFVVVMRSISGKLQQPDLTQAQATVIQDMFSTLKRMAQLNRSLLLLARIDNGQYEAGEHVDVIAGLRELLPSLWLLAGGIDVQPVFEAGEITLRCNRILLESLINNLVVNAVRHNKPGGIVRILLTEHAMEISNTSGEPALNPDLIFQRFYRPSPKTKGNGLGLAIVKAICDYHGWHITYAYNGGWHRFIVQF